MIVAPQNNTKVVIINRKAEDIYESQKYDYLIIPIWSLVSDSRYPLPNTSDVESDAQFGLVVILNYDSQLDGLCSLEIISKDDD